jgi:hypothetical protein
MKRLWYAFRCHSLGKHRWRELLVDEEKAFECRDCRKRVFGDQPPPNTFDIDKLSQEGAGFGGSGY